MEGRVLNNNQDNQDQKDQNDQQDHGVSEPNRVDQEERKKFSKRVIGGVVGILIALLVIIGVLGYRYFDNATQPYNSKDNRVVQVDIPYGASSKKIADILQRDKVIKSGFVFEYWTKAHNLSNFHAGYYQLKPSMSLSQIAKALNKGGSSEPLQSSSGKVLIVEGSQIKTIAKTVQKQTDFTSAEFLALMKNETFIKSLAKKYPQLLGSAMSAKKVRYRLEGYLFPATYVVGKKTTLKQLVTQMVSKTNDELEPYYAKIKKSKMSVQEVMTLASLVEREGSTTKDRRLIAGVFLNRLAAKWRLDSDISVFYAINSNKSTLTNKDLQNDSPYNLRLHLGYGPGPFNSPSLTSIKDVLDPAQRSKGYMYFVADLKTGDVYYAKTAAGHAANIKKVSKHNEAAEN
ncbi:MULTISPECIES: endolytic transglycosylase MltG [Lactiplantibacillus]|uniref:Endolytic murein transglycosylase n=1 Tax=Lactiplantibacillus pentosus TaxID=1589 RepID=A0AAW8WDK0_LACPE|nr:MULTISPECIES: endolytic transglycosylase MltG [Lactiplantibacillus]MBU7462285.1 endolytic transglycosylase MltG [Lactiplantibacillus pentosus]MBU7476174.1 endolytic transglycosylase MltG [Lactiplantibacillus pentosus]MBU7484687.1 endolytic transglycosylase MltG [Lactiplantibacillus sp. 30.2.29]MBU7486109.1 endolytic transglycosylase MltG [Lactiplantibacillus pentosus]MBU7499221.1 endolytic transglycosylase MltG [Lactiplantibacillus pentosus]